MPNYKELRHLYESAGPEATCQNLREAFAEGHLKASDFSIRQLFEAVVENGREVVAYFDPRQQGSGINLMEAGSAVDTSAFTNISGQIVFSAILEGFNDPIFLANDLAQTIPTQFDGERIPGIGGLGDGAEVVGEAQPYPTIGLNEEWIDTPQTVKRGFIVPVTKEAIFFDRTGILLRQASEVGRWLGVNKEKRVLDVAFGIVNNYKRNGAAAVDTYGDDSGTHDWDNLAASNGLTDWTDIENAELLFDGLLDPNTGEPILVTPDTIIMPSALKHTARRIVNATELQRGTDTVTNAALATIMISANPVAGQYNVLSSAYVKSRTSSASTWFIGQPKRAFAYMENFAIQAQQATSNSEAEFTHDIVARHKVSERGAAAVLEPRYMVKCTA